MLYMWKFQDVLESNIMINGIAIKKSTANKSGCNSSSESERHIPANTMKVRNMLKRCNDKCMKCAV